MKVIKNTGEILRFRAALVPATSKHDVQGLVYSSLVLSQFQKQVSLDGIVLYIQAA